MAVETKIDVTRGLDALRRRFTSDEYHAMVSAGILHEDDRVELIEGDIIQMAPVGDPHINLVDALNEIFVLAAAGKARVSVQNPVRLSPRSEPQPDLLLLRRESVGRGAGRPEDVLLLVEIADSSLAYDRGVKLSLYARAGIPRFLVVDVQGETIWLYTDPQQDRYRHVDRYTAGDRVTLKPLPDLTIEFNVDDIMS